MREILIEDYINKNYEKIINIRKTIHENPELSNKEFNTTNSIEKFLKENNIKFNRFKNINGGYVFLNNNKNTSIAYRADIDALPILERTNCSFSSKNLGIMHACGHDVHTTIALGLCLTLNNFIKSLKTNFLIVFQPAEENNPRGGSQDVINEGIFEQYNVKEIYGAHCWPGYSVGEVLVKEGIQQASSNKFRVEIDGVNSHAANPHLGKDAINLSIQFIDYAINKLRREISPHEVCVISIGKVESVGRYNVISNKVIIEGTIRSASEETKLYIFKRLRDYIKFLNYFNGTDSSIFISEGYGSVINDGNLVDRFCEFQSNFNNVNIINNFDISLIAEDFYAYSKVAKIMFVFLGCGTNESLHSEKFLPSEDVIKFGLLLFARYFILC